MIWAGPRPVITAGQVSDFIDARALLSSLSKAKVMLAERVYDSNWFREALADRVKHILHPLNLLVDCKKSTVRQRRKKKIQIPHDLNLYSQRRKIENMSGRLKNWRRLHTRYDWCARAFMSVIAIAAIVWACSRV